MDNNYVYLLQEREFIKTNELIYKIGRTKQEHNKRLNQYPKGSVLLFQIICFNCVNIENIIINIFKQKYKHRKDIGNEYFEGNSKDMIKEINDIVNNEIIEPNKKYHYGHNNYKNQDENNSDENNSDENNSDENNQYENNPDKYCYDEDQNDKKHNDDNEYRCVQCNKKYASFHSLNDHKIIYHNKEKYICNYNNDHDKFKYKCNYCNNIYCHRQSKHKHQKICKNNPIIINKITNINNFNTINNNNYKITINLNNITDIKTPN